MDYVRLGNTGLKVSRLCLGCHDLRLVEVAALGAGRRGLDGRSSRRRSRPGSTSSTPPIVYSQGESERVTGKALKRYAQAHEVVLATKVNGPMGCRPANNRGLFAQAHPRRHRPQPAAPRRRLRRPLPDPPLRLRNADRGDPWRRSTTSCAPARPGTSGQLDVRVAVHEDAERLEGQRLDPVVSMQPQYNLVYREEEREMLPLCKDQGVGRDPVVPAGAGLPGLRPRQSRRRQHRAPPAPTNSRLGSTTSAGPCGGRQAERPGPRARGLQHAAGAGLGAEEPHHHLADYRHVQGASPQTTRWPA